MKPILQWVRQFIIILTMAAILLGSSGCAHQVSQNTKKPLRIAWTLWDAHYSLLIAQEKGLFDKYGISVDLIYYENYPLVIPDLAAGKIDGSLFEITDMLKIAGRTSVKAVAVSDSGGLTTLVSVPEIRSAQDLVGKSIGAGLGRSGEMFIRYYLDQFDISFDKVTLLNLMPEEIPDALGNSIQAGITYEPYTSFALDKGWVALSSSETATVSPTLIVFLESITINRPEWVRGFLAAWFEAMAYRYDHPDECMQILETHTGLTKEKLELTAHLYTLGENRQLFQEDHGVGTQTIYSIAQTNIDFLIESGVLTRLLDIGHILDPAFLPSEMADGVDQ